ncbi:hypothetical protein FRC10_004837, partial [Ceratobasidium sp. 414]
QTGPLWASWGFVMELFCGYLLLAIKNRVRPYEHLDNFVQRSAQMHIVSQVCDLPTFMRVHIKYKWMHGVQMSSRKMVHLPCTSAPFAQDYLHANSKNGSILTLLSTMADSASLAMAIAYILQLSSTTTQLHMTTHS